MTRYKTRPGVVLTSICGEYVLVAAKSVWELCPYVTELNETSAFLWEHLRGGADLDGLMTALNEEYELDDPATARQAVEAFLRQMLELNYLLPEEQGECHEE
ncbi:MAG: PqqD family protein [Oscillospiraceae bacterium]|nr:PqqD family protein [Oscillospiraceae bacterium]